MRSRVSLTPRNETAKLAFGVAAIFVAYPAAMAVAARGMPDVGGLVLVACALRLAERLARLLALRQGRDARVEPMMRRVALALALTLCPRCSRSDAGTPSPGRESWSRWRSRLGPSR
jgi:hypothetical protein